MRKELEELVMRMNKLRDSKSMASVCTYQNFSFPACLEAKIFRFKESPGSHVGKNPNPQVLGWIHGPIWLFLVSNNLSIHILVGSSVKSCPHPIFWSYQ